MGAVVTLRFNVSNAFAALLFNVNGISFGSSGGGLYILDQASVIVHKSEE